MKEKKFVGNLKKVKLSEIIKDSQFQIRKDINGWIVSRYYDAMLSGSKFPPIIINQSKSVICGFHRLAAMRRLLDPNAMIIVDQRKLTDDQAYLLAVQDNTSHGYQLMEFDKKTIRRELQKRHEYSDEKISSILGISLEKFKKWDLETIMIDGVRKDVKSQIKLPDNMTQSQYDFHVKHHTLPTSFHARKIIERIEDKTIEDDEKTMTVLGKLKDLLIDII